MSSPSEQERPGQSSHGQGQGQGQGQGRGRGRGRGRTKVSDSTRRRRKQDHEYEELVGQTLRTQQTMAEMERAVTELTLDPLSRSSTAIPKSTPSNHDNSSPRSHPQHPPHSGRYQNPEEPPQRTMGFSADDGDQQLLAYDLRNLRDVHRSLRDIRLSLPLIGQSLVFIRDPRIEGEYVRRTFREPIISANSGVHALDPHDDHNTRVLNFEDQLVHALGLLTTPPPVPNEEVQQLRQKMLNDVTCDLASLETLKEDEWYRQRSSIPPVQHQAHEINTGMIVTTWPHCIVN